MNEAIFLDFEISKEQLEAFNLHLLFRQKGSYENLNVDELEGIDYIQVWFKIDYNDNTYDVDPIYLDLISDGKIVRKVKCYVYNDIKIPEYDGEEGVMQSFIITPKMLL